MSFNNFRELLIKKAAGNQNLQELIKIVRDDYLAEYVLDALAKMARPSSAMGRGANSALVSYAAGMDNTDIAQLKDAIQHHISRHKAALKAGNREVADQHLNRIIPLMHLAARARAHSNGKMDFDYVSTTPWETNYTQPDRHSHNGKLKEGTKDLGRRPKSSAVRPKSSPDASGNPRAVPDYRYLEMQPHEAHQDTESSPHKGGYPFEEIQLGPSSAVDNKQAYLHIPDVDKEQVKEFVPHEFDNHPINVLADKKQADLSAPLMENFANALTNWKSTPHHEAWKNRHKEEFTKDPEGYKKRGTVKPAHHFEGMQLQTQPHKIAQPSAAPAPAPEAPPKKEGE